MCGLFGVIGTTLSRQVLAEWPAHATRLAHRGPDDHGWLMLRGEHASRGRDRPAVAEADAIFLHWRLAIQDLSARAWQPFGCAGDDLFLLYNGEVYNFKELRCDLEREGQRFTSDGDTEVLYHAWRRWGPAAVERLIGMYAFAIVDLSTRRVHLVRDTFGIKPLYWARPAGGCVFASEIKGLLPLSGVSRTVDATRLGAYLESGFADDARTTFFQMIHQVPPGHQVVIDLDGDRAPEEHEISPRLRIRASTSMTFGGAASAVREQLLSNVALHLRSDVRVGTALSGGIDSSAVVMAMRSLGGDGLDMHAVSYVAGEPSIDEERWADRVAAVAGANVHKVQPAIETLEEDFETLLGVHDEPVVSSSVYAQYRVYRRAAAEGITVMLDGQGADELFAGYRPFLIDRLSTLLSQRRLLAATRLAGGVWRDNGVDAVRLSPRAWRMLARGNGDAAKKRAMPWLEHAWWSERDAVPHDDPAPLVEEAGGRLRGALIEATFRRSLPALLRYQDRNAMAFSVEARVPFLTNALAELAISMPEPYLIGADGTTKRVLRAALSGLVPAVVLERRDKIGFETPERRWLLSIRPWVTAVLESDVARTMPFLHHDRMMTACNSALAGHLNVTATVWRCVNLIRWVDRFEVGWE